MEDVLRIGRASQQGRGREDCAHEGEGSNIQLGRYDRPCRQAARARAATGRTFVVRRIARTGVALHERCATGHCDQEKPEGQNQETPVAHTECHGWGTSICRTATRHHWMRLGASPRNLTTGSRMP